MRRSPVARHKFNARRVVRDGWKFDSQREGERYAELRALQDAGEVVMFLMQVPFPIAAPVRDRAGRTLSPAERYVCDFLVFWRDGSCTVEDVKGYRTPEYRRKKRRVEALYPIEIVEL